MNIKYIIVLSFCLGLLVPILFWPSKPNPEIICKPIQESLDTCSTKVLESSKRCLQDKEALINTCKKEMDEFCAEKIKDLESVCNEINCHLMEILCLDK